MKKIIAAISVMLLLCSCSLGSSNPQKTLKKLIDKQMGLDSVTCEGTIRLKASVFSGKMKMTIKTNNTGNKDTDDDELYIRMNLSALGQSEEMEFWMKDQTLYLDNGSSKYCQEIDDVPSFDFDADDLYETITDHIDDVSVSRKNRNTIITIIPDDRFISSLMKTLMDQYIEIDNIDGLDELDNAVIDEIVITIGPKGYITNISADGEVEIEGISVDLSVDMDYSDFNSTKIPRFDPDDFEYE